jgi:mannosyltransferase OCH1-like enzyme
MIPKIIHYCWFGRNPLPELAQRCIASWRKYLPDYEIWQWAEEPLYDNENQNENQNDRSARSDASLAKNENQNDNNLFDRKLSFDVNIIPYTAEAYRQKKYAFVSDYARFWILYQYGGIYFDTDVEVIRPMDDIIARGNFMGFEVDPDGENTPGNYAPRYCFDVALGLGFGISKSHPFMQKMMHYYAHLEFKGAVMNPWFKTIVAYTTEKLMEDGLQNKKGIQQVGDIAVYPHDYFAPINVISGKLHITKNTYTIHWYMGSWYGENENHTFNIKYLKKRMRNAIPEWAFFLINRIKRRRYRIK